MITAIDFGCYAIRSAWRSPTASPQLTLFNERAEYAVLPGQDSYRQALEDRQICYAECDGSLVVFGDRAGQVRWLSRMPCAPLFAEGSIPTSDAPARQILHVLINAILPKPDDENSTCCFTVPGGRGRTENADFLSRLIRMNGFEPRVCSSAESLILASGNDSSFTGITLAMGAATSEVSVCRFGVPLASETIPVGANWIDAEVARQFKFQVWDVAGDCYLDHEAVREWKHDSRVHLRTGIGEREKTLARLYGEVLDRIARSVQRLLVSPAVKSTLGSQRLAVFCAGGPTVIGGFASALTERFVDHNVASDIVSVKTVDDPLNAVVRGLLIHGELEQRKRRPERSAA